MFFAAVLKLVLLGTVQRTLCGIGLDRDLACSLGILEPLVVLEYRLGNAEILSG